MGFRIFASILALSVVACGGRVVVDHGSTGGNGGNGGHGGLGGMGGISVGTFSTGDVNPITTGVGGFGGTMSTGDVNPVTTGVGGFGGTMSTGDVSPVGVSVSQSSSASGMSACMAFECSGGFNHCKCKGQCADGGTAKVICTPMNSSPNEFRCACFRNGMVVGECMESTPKCDFPGSCCDAAF